MSKKRANAMSGVVVSVTTLCGAILPAAAFAEDDGNVLDWLSTHNVEIRKSFAGTAKDAGEPASLTFVDADDGDEFYGIDLAVKMASWNWDQGATGNWQGRVYPTVERHRFTQDTNKVNNTSVSAGAEFERHLRTCTSPSGAGEIRFCRSLFMDFTAKAKDDSVKEQTTRSVSLLFGYFGATDRAPGAQIRTRAGLFSYMPTVSLEHYDKLPIEVKVNGQNVLIAEGVDEAFQNARINIEYRPLADRLDNRLALLLNHTQRWLVGSSAVIDHHTDFTEFSVSYFLDEKRRVAIGFNFSDGENPERNFIDEETSSIGFKLKL